MRIHQNNVKSYLKQTYGATPILKQQIKIDGFTPLLQNDYGEENDCTLTSITSIVYFLSKHKYSVETIYNYTEKIAKKYGYKGTRGTSAIVVRKIFHKVLNQFNLPKAYAKYGKNLGFTFKTIQEELKKSNPMILSMKNDGRNYYKSHSITAIGYEIYVVGNKEVPILLVQDNWYKSIGYLDFNRISTISFLHYSKITFSQKHNLWKKLKNLK